MFFNFCHYFLLYSLVLRPYCVDYSRLADRPLICRRTNGAVCPTFKPLSKLMAWKYVKRQFARVYTVIYGKKKKTSLLCTKDKVHHHHHIAAKDFLRNYSAIRALQFCL
jgi:hypothetical protein